MKLEVKNITKSFGEKEVLHGVSFVAESGKALGLLGRNGAGKTTSIRIIMDVFRANSGEILLDGEPFNPKKHLIGYLPEERGLYPKKNVTEQLIYLGRLRGLSKAKAAENTKKWLDRLGVSEYANVKLETLSKGNQQKVQLASTLVCDPDIVILDEPFSGLDPVNSRVLQEVVVEIINMGKIVIFSSHQMSYVEEFCENIAMIEKGNVVLSGNLDEIKTKFGNNRLILSGVDINGDELASIIEKNCSEYLTVSHILKDAVIVDNIKELPNNDIISLVMKAGINLLSFDIYKPSLNDIFVRTVGKVAEDNSEEVSDNE